MRHRFQIPRLPDDPGGAFPNPAHSQHPEGLIAWGGDLKPERLLNAYRSGIFPWFEHGSPILWWSPQPRAVFYPGHWQPPRRLARSLRQGRFATSMDRAFNTVVSGCAAPRAGQQGTWITPSMQQAYHELHRLGHAHSVETWDGDELVGGLYGVAIGRVFFAESKFHRRTDASKVALGQLLAALNHWGFLLADCQLWNPHLERLGVELISRPQFIQALGIGLDQPDQTGSWTERYQHFLAQSAG